jgi:hypothetical protein
MKQINAYLFNACYRAENSRFFKYLLYGFLMLKSAVWLLNSSLLFNEPTLSFIQHEFVNHYSYPAFVLFLSSHYAVLGPAFAAALLILSFIQLIRPTALFAADVLIWLLVLNLHLFNYSTLSGGDALLNNLCFFNLFLLKKAVIPDNPIKQWRVAIHNTAFAALIIQVCIVYMFSALAKWADADWLSGEAVNSVNSAPQYSRDFLVTHASLFYYPSMFLTWLVLLYQTAFPLGMFWKPLKRWFIPVGVLMHLYIAFVMGLFFFGVTMILVYVLFFDFKASSRQ